MSSKRNDTTKPVDRLFMLRFLKKATDDKLKVNLQNSFRPNMTVYHLFDKEMENAANVLVGEICGNEKDFIEHANTKMLLALISTKHDLKVKVPVVNLVIKWIMFHQVEEPIRNVILMSIHLPFWSLDKVIRLRLGLHIYFTTSKLNSLYDINMGGQGDVYIRKKKGLSSDHYPKTLIEVCRQINKITDKYPNFACPQVTARRNPELMKWVGDKLILPKPIISFFQLSNPLYKWGFDTAEQITEKEMQEVPQKKPALSSGFEMNRPDKRAIVETSNNSSGAEKVHSEFSKFPSQRKLMKPLYYRKIEKHSTPSVSTTTSSSGYQSLISSFSDLENAQRKELKTENRAVHRSHVSSQRSGSSKENMKHNIKYRNINKTQINNDKRIPDTVDSFRYPIPDRCSKKAPNDKDNSKYDVDEKLLYKYNEQNVPPVPNKTSESAVAAFLAKRREAETYALSSDFSETCHLQFYFDISRNVIEMKHP